MNLEILANKLIKGQTPGGLLGFVESGKKMNRADIWRKLTDKINWDEVSPDNYNWLIQHKSKGMAHNTVNTSLDKQAKFLIPTILIKQSGYFDKAKDGEDNYGLLDWFVPGTVLAVGNTAYEKGVVDPLVRNNSSTESKALAALRSLNSNADNIKFESDSPSHYNPKDNTITINKNHSQSAGVLAHELGHRDGMQKYKALPRIYQGGNILGGLGSLVAGFTENKDTADKASLLGTIGYGGVVGNELDASLRGYNMLRNTGLGKLRSLKSFMGVPTYLGLMASPHAINKWKEHKGGYKNS